MRLSRACACSLRRNATCSIPSSRTSSTKSARPVSSRASSLRRTRLPTSRGWGATGQLHRVDDVLVARAAAQVPAQRVADLRIAGGCVVAQERDERHEDAGGAEAALQRVRLAESRLQRVELVRAARREALDGRQLSAVRLHREHQAGAHRLAVEQHGAGAAHAVLAADVGAGEPQVLAEEVAQDQPVLAAVYVRHVHEPVLLLAHRDRVALRRAVAAVTIEVAPEPAALDFRVPPRPEQIQYGADNVLKHLRIEKGDVERALATAPVVVEGVYETGAQEHVYLEPQGMIAHMDGDVLVVRGSMQCPYYVVKALTHALNRDEQHVRVVQTPTGGGFGGKEEYPSTIALHAALLALKSGRPVKLVYDRTEDMAATTKRHPARVRHRTGVTRDGKLVAQDIEVLMDGGAYVTLSPVVLSRGIIHAAGPYACKHVRIDGRAMFTNAVPFGAFRGFGAPQTHFAGERHMDVVAHRLGIDPAELRRRNLLRDGERTATGQVVNDGTDRVAVLERALALADYDKKRAANKAGRTTRRGIGIATFHHGAGFTGRGEVMLSSRVDVAGLPDGRIEVLSANIEMGQGTITGFTALAPARLGLTPDDGVV